MLKTYLYVPDLLQEKIQLAAKIQNQSKAETMRQALEKGITLMTQQGASSAKFLLTVADLGKKYQVDGPSDSSTNMDQYLWDQDWSQNQK